MNGTIPRPDCCKECFSSNVNLVSRSPWDDYSHTWECAACGLVLGAAKAKPTAAANTVTTSVKDQVVAVGLHGAKLYIAVNGTLYEAQHITLDGINLEPYRVWQILSDGGYGWDFEAVEDFARAVLCEVSS